MAAVPARSTICRGKGRGRIGVFMIKYIEGDIFRSPAKVLVNTVNTVGVMGKGIALEYKNRYPHMFEIYEKACKERNFSIGNLLLVQEKDHEILLFPTKQHWRSASKMEYIQKGLETLRNNYVEYGITSIAMPKLGCGNGGLDWDSVRSLIEQYLKCLPIDVYVYLDNIKERDTSAERKREGRSKCDLSVEGLHNELAQYTIVPFPLFFEGKQYEISWNEEEGICVQSVDEKTIVSKEQLSEIWDTIREEPVFTEENAKIRGMKMLYSFLEKQGYLSLIHLYNPQNDKMYTGYQLDAGKGRRYAMEG